MRADRQTAAYKFLIVDDSAFQRQLISETLRAFGATRVEYAPNPDECFETFSYFMPDVLIAGWTAGSNEGLELVRRIRVGEAGSSMKRVSVLMVADRNKARDIEIARNVGVDEFLLRPFNTASLLARIEAITQRRRDFVESVVYVGPCRRRKMVSDYDGPLRRLFDVGDEDADTPDVQIQKGLARMYAERITMLLADAKPGNLDGVRNVSIACAQLQKLTADLGEKLLLTASTSLMNYVQGLGAERDLNEPVIRAHLDALVQLAELPNSQADIRHTVTQELKVMVSKKLRQASPSAAVEDWSIMLDA